MDLTARISNWLKQRTGHDVITPLVQKKTVPIDGLSLKYYLGGAVAFFFMLQVVTGLLLAMYYVPTVRGAFRSIETITFRVEYGWLVRSVHHWAAQLMVMGVFLHMVTVFWNRAYQSPRELTWISGCLMLGIVLSICFFGYLLPWNELSFSATCTGIQIIEKLPLLGKDIVEIVQGGGELTSETLTRFYTFHTMLLPALLFLVLAAHIYMIQVHGMSEPMRWRKAADDTKRHLPFYPDFMRRIMVSWVVLINILLLLAMLFPLEPGEEADRFTSTPSDIKPEWYFLFLYKSLKLMPAIPGFINGEILVLGIVSLGALSILLIPFIDGKRSFEKRAKTIRAAGIVMLVYLVLMTVWGYMDQSAVARLN
jgi:cytochrome b6